MPAEIEFLRSILDYDPLTGVMSWKVTRGVNAVAGASVGTPNEKGYLLFDANGKRYRVHRVAFAVMTGRWPDAEIDHKNQNRADNRWGNLREATPAQNNANSGLSKNNSTGFKGVTYDKRKRRYVARTKINKKTIHLGQFKDALSAHEAYCAFMRSRFGEYFHPASILD